METSVRSSILWRQVWGLGALLAAIVLSWMAYGLYQPQILQRLGFMQLAANLAIIQGLLGAIIEPLVGNFSDRIMQRVGNRLPIITAGVATAGLIFIVVAFLVEANLPEALRWLVPVMMTLWVMAMITFRGPAIALLIQLAPTAELPKANAVLLLIFGLVGALGPLVGKLLQQVGASVTFVLGAIALIVGATLLYKSLPSHHLPTLPTSFGFQASPGQLARLFAVGLGTGLEVNLLMSLAPAALHRQLPGVMPELIATGILLIGAIAAVPLGDMAIQIGIRKAMLMGLGAIPGFMLLAAFLPGAIAALILLVIFGMVFGLVFISMVPYALTRVPPTQAGLGTGLYFGGAAAATAISTLLVQQMEVSNLAMGAAWAIATFFPTALCIVASKATPNS